MNHEKVVFQKTSCRSQVKKTVSFSYLDWGLLKSGTFLCWKSSNFGLERGREASRRNFHANTFAHSRFQFRRESGLECACALDSRDSAWRFEPDQRPVFTSLFIFTVHFLASHPVARSQPKVSSRFLSSEWHNLDNGFVNTFAYRQFWF